jgi:hypothetical protein
MSKNIALLFLYWQLLSCLSILTLTLRKLDWPNILSTRPIKTLFFYGIELSV